MGKVEKAGERLSRAGVPPVQPIHPASDSHFKNSNLRQGAAGGKFTFKQHLIAEWFKGELRRLIAEDFEGKMLREANAAKSMWLAANPGEAQKHIEKLLELAGEEGNDGILIAKGKQVAAVQQPQAVQKAGSVAARLGKICSMESSPHTKKGEEEEQMRLLFSRTIAHNFDQAQLAIIGAADIVLFTMQVKCAKGSGVNWDAMLASVQRGCGMLRKHMKEISEIDVDKAETISHPAGGEMFKI